MEREQILKVMVPVGAFALLLLIIGVVIAVGGGGTPPSSANPPGTPPPLAPGTVESGTVPLDADGMVFEIPAITGPEWKDANSPHAPGLKVWEVKTGTEETTAVSTDSVTVHYSGWLASGGRQFDGSVSRGQPISFSLGKVIAGWTHGIPGMKIGGIRRLYIPAQFAYANDPPQGSGIPPNADLVFEVKLLRVQRPK